VIPELGNSSDITMPLQFVPSGHPEGSTLGDGLRCRLMLVRTDDRLPPPELDPAQGRSERENGRYKGRSRGIIVARWVYDYRAGNQFLSG
jgi:hypothetical protein